MTTSGKSVGPIEVAVIGSGPAAISAAFELTRPEHRGKYRLTIYQVGWRFGGKSAAGRGRNQRIEEHGLHLWLGYYENAFRLLRECYAELGPGPTGRRFADWRDAFLPSPTVTLADDTPEGTWRFWTACFPPSGELPGDPLPEGHRRPTLAGYLIRSAQLLGTLLLSARTDPRAAEEPGLGSFGERREPVPRGYTGESLQQRIQRVLRYGRLATLAAWVEAVRALELGLGSLPGAPRLLLRLVDLLGVSARSLLETLLEDDDELRRIWEIVDLMLAILRGVLRFGLLTNPRGLDAIDSFDSRTWLWINGASRRTLDSSFLRSLYNLGFAYQGGDARRPGMAAGQGLRGFFRMFFTYRGAFFWKMRGSMGDLLFAPLYEVLRRRGVRFRFFHRLENVCLAAPDPLQPWKGSYVEALELDTQAEIKGGGEYRPLIEVDGAPAWPAEPCWEQLVDGETMRREKRSFESHWDRHKVGRKTLRVGEDFDFVVLGVGLGAVPFVCSELVERDGRWRAMVEKVETIATQATQLWMRPGLDELGWSEPLATLTGYVNPFDTWADMSHLLQEERWPRPAPGSLAYFCAVLPTPEGLPDRSDAGYPKRKHEEVRRNVVRFLNRDVARLWPRAESADGRFRWELLAPGAEGKEAAEVDERRLDGQLWSANVNPSDRYVLSLPGTLKYRISPLDNTYDNLTLAGDWTDCGYNMGCVEAAVLSGRLAAHALSGWPRLEDIVGYDHP